MKEQYTDCKISPDYSVRIIIPDDNAKKLIAGELEESISGPIIVKGIIAANVSHENPSNGVLWYNMNGLKIKHFGKEAYNTGVYMSFDNMKSALTPERKSYKEGTGSCRFDMIVYEK